MLIQLYRNTLANINQWLEMTFNAMGLSPKPVRVRITNSEHIERPRRTRKYRCE